MYAHMFASTRPHLARVLLVLAAGAVMIVAVDGTDHDGDAGNPKSQPLSLPTDAGSVAEADSDGDDAITATASSTAHSRPFMMVVLTENGSTVLSHQGITTNKVNAAAFQGWLLPVNSCDLSDITPQTAAQHVVAVFSAALMAQCSRYDVAEAARLKSIRGIVELSPGRHGRPVPSVEPVVSLGSHDGIVPWFTFQTASTHYLMFQMAQSWLWIEVESHEVDWEPEDSQTTARDAAVRSGEGHRWPTVEGDDKDDALTDGKDDAADKKAGLLLYIVIGTFCGALTGLTLLTMLRICLQCRRSTNDAERPASAAMRDAIGRRLVSMPVRPYPQLKLGQLKIHCDDDSEVPCAVCLDDMRLSNRCRQLPCGHVYHADCIDPWLIEHHTCPMCICNVVTGSPVGLYEDEEFEDVRLLPSPAEDIVDT